MENMQNWVHCNKCLIQPSKNNLSFWMSSCGHIFCKDCIDGDVNGYNMLDANSYRQCLICNKQVKYIQINHSMRKDLLEMFQPPTLFFGDSLKKAKSIIEFQSMHHQRLLKCLQEKNQKCFSHLRKMQKELDERENRIKMLEMESDEYKSEIELTKRTIGDLKKTISDREIELYRLHQMKQTNSNNINNSNNSGQRHMLSYKRIAIQNAMDTRYTNSGGGLSFLNGGDKVVQTPQFNLMKNNTTQQTNEFHLNMQFGVNTPITNNDLQTNSQPDLNLQNLMNTSTGSGETNNNNVGCGGGLINNNEGNIVKGLQNTATLLGYTRTTESTARDYF